MPSWPVVTALLTYSEHSMSPTWPVNLPPTWALLSSCPRPGMKRRCYDIPTSHPSTLSWPEPDGRGSQVATAHCGTSYMLPASPQPRGSRRSRIRWGAIRSPGLMANVSWRSGSSKPSSGSFLMDPDSSPKETTIRRGSAARGCRGVVRMIGPGTRQRSRRCARSSVSWRRIAPSNRASRRRSATNWNGCASRSLRMSGDPTIHVQSSLLAVQSDRAVQPPPHATRQLPRRHQ